MHPNFDLWIEYLLRFSHLVAGISWIGSSFYFIWLDSAFEIPETPRRNVEGEVFMVHGGFYYQVEKKKIYPGELPKLLHWFKWEATLTWITGFLLLIVLYFLKGASLLVDPSVAKLTHVQAVTLSLGILTVSWLIYDYVLWNVREFLPKIVSVFASLIFFSGLIVALTHLFSGRGAFILTGAIFGTMMLLNVWVRILPGQAKMLREAQAGQVPDYSVSLKSKTRSVHNTYFIFPVLFIMLSNHYPIITNHSQNAILLILLTVAGASTRHAMVTKNPVERWTLLPAAIALFVLIAMTGSQSLASAYQGPRIEYAQVHSIMRNRCFSCHSSYPTDDVFKVAPKGTLFETEDQVRARGQKIYEFVVQTKIMPLANKTQMTDDERTLIANWIRQERLNP